MHAGCVRAHGSAWEQGGGEGTVIALRTSVTPRPSGRARRAYAEMLLSAGAAAIVVAVLVSMDFRVREQAGVLARSIPAATVAGSVEQARKLGSLLSSVAASQSIDRAPLLVFVSVATILVLYMSRS